MRLSCVILIASLLQVSATGYSQNAFVSIHTGHITLEQLFSEIEKQANVTFLYRYENIAGKTAQVNVENAPVATVLNKALSSNELKYTLMDNNLIVVAPVEVQQQVISGTITDESGEPIPGVNVILKGTTTGTVTDLNGKYAVSAPDANTTLVFSFIGYTSQEVLVANQREINVTLTESSLEIDEVVVTALGIKREEKGLGYAVQNVNAKELTTVKTVDVATKLTGKVAGLNVQNSTEFNEAPTMLLRGEKPLLVIDGIPYQNMTLSDVAADDIESISILKGATASALYGERGKSGAVMITTKRGGKEGLNVEVNSSAMFTAGFLTMPEVQTSYSGGSGGKYATGDYVWGDRLDVGRTAKQHNPFTYEWEEIPLESKGKNNLKNFQQTSYVLNNNISVSQQGKYGGFRTSVTYVYNRGQYPNTKLNKVTATAAGNMKFGNFDMEAGITYNKRAYPNKTGSGYGGGGFLYNLIVWSGSEFDIRDYKNYWVAGKEGYQQNWMDTNWYSNPYFIANEIIHSNDYDVTNGFLTANYQIRPWLKATFRSGIDAYSEKDEYRNPISAAGGWNKKGYYYQKRGGGYSWNNDFLLFADHKIGNFGIDGFVGGTVYYYQNDNMSIESQNGLTVPGYYSIYASVDPPKATQEGAKKQVNSLYAKATLSWKSMLFIDITGRNDWSSTLKSDERSYFYPSIAGSWVINETFSLPKEISLLKLRGSWTQTKEAPDVYAIYSPYGISTNMWDGKNGAYYPANVTIDDKSYSNVIRSNNILPQSSRTYEFGLGSNFYANRIRFDIAYYNKLYYDQIKAAEVSDASGFSYSYVNFGEEVVRKGVEITLGGTPIHTGDWRWDITLNWSRDRRYYHKTDAKLSEDKPWVAKGKRYDAIKLNDWERSPDGQLIHYAGSPKASNYSSLFGYSDPDWVWGISNTIQWKKLTLGFSFDGRVGGHIFNSTNQAMWNSGAHIESDNDWRYAQVMEGKNNYVGQGVKVVSGEVSYDVYGNITSDSRIFAPNDQETSYETYTKLLNPYIGTEKSQNHFLQTFFKLRELSLSYELPTGIAKSIGMKGASVSIIGQNLLLWTKEFKYSDPDKASDKLNSPSIRYIGGNIKLNF